MLRAAAILRQFGAQITTAVCVLDRDLGGSLRLAREQIALQSLLATATLNAESPA